jgi:hypothetical protein
LTKIASRCPPPDIFTILPSVSLQRPSTVWSLAFSLAEGRKQQELTPFRRKLTPFREMPISFNRNAVSGPIDTISPEIDTISPEIDTILWNAHFVQQKCGFGTD